MEHRQTWEEDPAEEFVLPWDICCPRVLDHFVQKKRKPYQPCTLFFLFCTVVFVSHTLVFRSHFSVYLLGSRKEQAMDEVWEYRFCSHPLSFQNVAVF